MKLRIFISALLTLGAALPAQAYERSTTADCPNGVELFHGASGSVRFGLSLDTYKEEAARQAGEVWEDLDLLERLEVALGPFDRVHRRIGEVAGSSASLVAVLGPSVDPALGIDDLLGEIFHSSTNEVVFSEAEVDGAVAATFSVLNAGNCRILEADIVFFDGAQSWRFFAPEDYGTPYYDTGRVSQWVQTIYLHELLHALGLEHTPDKYTYLNYGNGLARSKRDTSDSAPEPLPDERTALRAIYPVTTGSDEFDLLLTNTWFDDAPATIVQNAVPQRLLCPPSRARNDNANPGQFTPIEPMSADACNPAAGNTVCPGQDSVAVAYAASNNGVVPEWVVHELWFSLDEELDTTQDVESPDNSFFIETLDAYESALNTRYFQVPAGLTANTDYHVIARVRRFSNILDQPTSQLRERSYRNNWIPLRGQVRASCN
jgi:hypothetical protein